MAIHEAMALRFKNKVEKPKLEQNQQFSKEDIQNIIQMPVDAVNNTLSVILQGETGALEGLNISIKNKREVFLSPGYGIVTNIGSDDKLLVDGTYLIVNNEDDKYLFTLPVSPIGTEFFIYLKHITIEGDEKTRTFIREDGTKDSRIVSTKYIHSFEAGYENVSILPEKVYNKLYRAKITMGGTGTPTVIEQFPTRIITLYQHRLATPIDHPDSSIKAEHIDPVIMGNYVEGTDLTIKKISQSLKNLAGNTSSPDERISVVIDNNGNINNEAIVNVVDQLVQKYLSGLTDGQGNLSQSAIDNAKDDAGRPLIYRIGVKSGQVDGDGGKLPIPEGFTVNDCVFIVSIGRLGWDQNPGTSVEINCFEENGIGHCYAVVQGTNEKKYFGSLNCLSLGIKPLQS